MSSQHIGDFTWGMKIEVDQSSIKRVQNALKSLQNTTVDNIKYDKGEEGVKKLKELQNEVKNYGDVIKKAFNQKLNTLELSKFNQLINLGGKSLNGMYTTMSQLGAVGKNAFLQTSSQILNANNYLNQQSKLVNNIKENISKTLNWSIYSSIFNTIGSKISEAYGYVKALDTSLNNIRIVTGKSADEMQRFAEQAQKSAAALGKGTKDYTNASLIYYQQGLSDEEVKARTDVTMKAANVTGQQASTVSEQLTAVWNGYKVSAQEAEVYVDKLAAVAATTASNLQELSVGMSKVASAANLVGVDVDQMNAILSTTISVTRQAPESVGTAYKTILARMTTISAGGVDEEDGATLTSYTEKMNGFGISVLDSNGKLREMGEVIEEVGEKWKTMSKEQKISLAQTMAGTRQYNNLTALFDNWDKYTAAIKTSQEATGTLQKQQDVYMESTAAHLQQLTTAAEGVFDSLLKSTDINQVVDGFTSITQSIEKIIDVVGGGSTILKDLVPILTMFMSKELANGIVRFGTNIQGSLTNIANIKAQSDILNQFSGLNIADPTISKAIKDMVELRQEATQYSSVMTDGQNKIYESAIQTTATLAQQKVELENNVNTINEKLLKVESLPEGVNKLNLGMSQQQIREINNLLDDQIQTVYNLIDAIKDLTQEEDNVTEKQINDAKDATNIYNQISNRVKNLDEDANKTFENIAKGEKVTADQAQRLVDELNKIRLSDEGVVGLVDEFEQANNQINLINDNVSVLQNNMKSIGGAIKKAFDLQGVIKGISAIGSAAMGVQQLTNVGNDLKDNDKSNTEKLQSVLIGGSMGISMLAPTAKGGFDKISGWTNASRAKKLTTRANDSKQAADSVMAKASDAEQIATKAEEVAKNDIKKYEANLKEVRKYANLIDPNKSLSDYEQSYNDTKGRNEAFKNKNFKSSGKIKKQMQAETNFKNAQNNLENKRKYIASKEALNNSRDIYKSSTKEALSARSSATSLRTSANRATEIAERDAAMAKAANDAAKGSTTFGESVAALGAQIAPMLPMIIAITAAIAALTIAYVRIKNAIIDVDEAQKQANENFERSKKEYNNITQTVSELKSSLDGLKNTQEELSELTKGTDEWKAKLEDVNTQLDELILKYPKLKEQAVFENGHWTISQEELDAFYKAQETAQKNAQSRMLAAEIAVKQADYDVANKKVINDNDNVARNIGIGLTSIVLGQPILGSAMITRAREEDADKAYALQHTDEETLQKIKQQVDQEIREGNAYSNSEEAFELFGTKNLVTIQNQVENLISLKQEEIELEKAQKENAKAILDLNFGTEIEEKLKAIGVTDENTIKNITNAVEMASSNSMDALTQTYIEKFSGVNSKDVNDKEIDTFENYLKEKYSQVYGVDSSDIKINWGADGGKYSISSKGGNFDNIEDTEEALIKEVAAYTAANSEQMQAWVDSFSNMFAKDEIATLIANIGANQENINGLSKKQIKAIKDLSESSPTKFKSILETLGLTQDDIQTAIKRADEIQNNAKEELKSEKAREAFNVTMSLEDADTITQEQIVEIKNKIYAIAEQSGEQGLDDYINKIQGKKITAALEYEVSEESAEKIDEETQKRLKALKLTEQELKNLRVAYGYSIEDSSHDDAILRSREAKKELTSYKKNFAENNAAIERIANTKDSFGRYDWMNASEDDVETLTSLVGAFQTLTGEDVSFDFILDNFDILKKYFSDNQEEVSEAVDFLNNTFSSLSLEENTIDLNQLFTNYKIDDGEQAYQGLQDQINLIAKRENLTEKEIADIYNKHGYFKNSKGEWIKSLKSAIEFTSDFIYSAKTTGGISSSMVELLSDHGIFLDSHGVATITVQAITEIESELAENGFNETEIKDLAKILGTTEDELTKQYLNMGYEETKDEKGHILLKKGYKLITYEKYQNIFEKIGGTKELSFSELQEKYGKDADVIKAALIENGATFDKNNNKIVLPETIDLVTVITHAVRAEEIKNLLGDDDDKRLSQAELYSLAGRYADDLSQELREAGLVKEIDKSNGALILNDGVTTETILEHVTKVLDIHTDDDSNDTEGVNTGSTQTSSKSFSEQTKSYKYIYDYSHYNKQIEVYKKELESLQKIQDELTGDALIKNLERQLQLQKDIVEQNKLKTEEAEKNLEIEKQKLAGTDFADALNNEFGYSENFQNRQKELEAQRNALAEQYNGYATWETDSNNEKKQVINSNNATAAEGVKQKIDEIDKQIKENEQQIENYQKALEEYTSAVDAWAESRAEQTTLIFTKELAVAMKDYKKVEKEVERETKKYERFKKQWDRQTSTQKAGSLAEIDKADENHLNELRKQINEMESSLEHMGPNLKSAFVAATAEYSNEFDQIANEAKGLGFGAIQFPDLTGDIEKDTEALDNLQEVINEYLINLQKIEKSDPELYKVLSAYYTGMSANIKSSKEEMEKLGDETENTKDEAWQLQEALRTDEDELRAIRDWGNETFDKTIKQIDKGITKLDRQLSKLSKQESKLKGDSLIKNLNQQKTIIQQQIAQTKLKIAQEQQRIKMLKTELAIEKNILETQVKQSLAKKGINISFKYNQDGTIDKGALKEWITKNADSISNTDMEYIQTYVGYIDDITDKIQSAQDAIDGYEQDIEGYLDSIKDLADKAKAALLEKFNLKIEIELQVTDLRRKLRDVQDAVNKVSESDIFANAKKEYDKLLTYIQANPGAYAEYAAGGEIQNTLQHMEEIRAEFESLNGGGTSRYYETAKDAYDDMMNYAGKVLDSVQGFEDAIKSVKDAFKSAIDQMISKQDELRGDIESITSAYSSQLELIKLVYGDESYDRMVDYYDGIKEATEQQYEASKRQVEYYKQLLATLDPNKNKEEYDAVKNALKSAMANAQSDGTALVNAIHEQTMNNIHAAEKEFEDFAIGMTNHSSKAAMEQAWEYETYMMDNYLDDINAAYETQTLMNKFNKSINDTSSLSAKRKLTDVMNEQLEILEKQDKLTQYDIDRANLKYELTLKQIALEEAQNNKSQMRLRRDSQGNYRYEYVSDQNQIADAQQALLDAQNKLYNLDKDQARKTTEQVYALYKEYSSKIDEIANNNNLNEEQRQELLAQLYDQYWGDDGEITNMMVDYNEAMDNLFETSNGNMTVSAETFAGALSGNPDSVAAKAQEMQAAISEALQVADEKCEELGANIEETLKNNIEITKEWIAQDEELISKYEQEIEDVRQLVAELAILEEQYKALEDAAMAAVDAASQLRPNLDDGSAETGVVDNTLTSPASTTAATQGSGDKKSKEEDTQPTTHGILAKVSGNDAVLAQDISQEFKDALIKQGYRPGYYGMDFYKNASGTATYLTAKFDTGGYTGAWGTDGKMAMLHEKEIVLNKTDTENFLQGTYILRGLANSLSGLQQIVNSGINNTMNNASAISVPTNTQLDQNVRIEANFPNVSNSSEIEQAFNNLVNLASQRAMSTRR